MQMRLLGKTGMHVSRLGLGLAALGRPGYITLGHRADLRDNHDDAAMESRCQALLDEALQLGIRYFDAARSYGRAETFLSHWLASRHIDPALVIVGSKWGYTYTADWKVEAERHEVKDHTLPQLLRQTAESQQLLEPHLRLYQIHSATLESGVLDNTEVLRELARLREGGLHIGLSLSGPRQAEVLRRALACRIGNDRVFDCVQATWNLLEPSAGPALREAHDNGLGVIIKEAVANGRLTTRNLEPDFAARRHLLEAEAARLRTTLDGLALAAALAQPWADIVLSGAAAIDHLRSNAQALTVPWDQGAAARLQAVAEAPEEYWTVRSRLPWN